MRGECRGVICLGSRLWTRCGQVATLAALVRQRQQGGGRVGSLTPEAGCSRLDCGAEG